MESIEDEIKKINPEDLINKEICYRCVAVCIPIRDCLRDYNEMFASPSTYNFICQHCYDTEIEFGYEKMNRQEAKFVWNVVDKIKECIEKRFNS